MGLRETKKERTRALLLDAALTLIREKGFEQTTISEIAEAVQVSSRTLLRYFPTKEDVVVAWVDDEFSLLRETLAGWPADVPPFEAMKAAMRAYLLTYQEKQDFFLMIETVIAGSGQISACKAARASNLVSDLSAILGRRMGMDAARDVWPDLIAGLVWAAGRAAIRAWMAGDGKDSLMRLFDLACAGIRFDMVTGTTPDDHRDNLSLIDKCL